MTQCGICGKLNRIVNECRCDPNNLPTVARKQKPVLSSFVGRSQASAIRSAMRGEEGDWFRSKMKEMQAIIDGMPVSYETDGDGKPKVAQLHYFGGNSDAWIVELDKGSPDDTPEDYQSQAWGMVDLGYGAETGYVSIPELLANGLELDLYWKPKTLDEIKDKRG